jgi:hypothetical protein
VPQAPTHRLSLRVRQCNIHRLVPTTDRFFPKKVTFQSSGKFFRVPFLRPTPKSTSSVDPAEVDSRGQRAYGFVQR